MRTYLDVWKLELANSNFRVRIFLSFVAFVGTLSFFTRFLDWVEQRSGVVLNDPILSMIEPKDFTWLTFSLIYTAVLIAVLHLGNKPKDFLLAIQSYTLLVIVRAAMMFLVPLEPPEGLIVLRDPFVQFVGSGAAPTKDLFFSGHTSTMFLLSLVIKHRAFKNMYLLFTLLVATCVIWQHVHYVIDVVVAPFAAYGCHRSARYVADRVE